MYGPGDIANRLVEDFWQAFQQHGPVAIPIWALMWLLGYLSLRFLRDLPDFEHKRKMMWGAKWHWTIYTGILAVLPLTIYFGFTLSPYPTTSILVALVLMHLLFALDLVLLPHQGSGHIAIIDLWGARLKKQSFDFDSWIARERKNRVKQRRIRYAVAAFWVLVWVGTGGYLVVTSSLLSFDRQLSAMRQQAALAESIKARLANPLVEEVVVGAPPVVEWRKVVIRMANRATDKQIASTQREAGLIVQEVDPDHDWKVDVYIRNGEHEHNERDQP